MFWNLKANCYEIFVDLKNVLCYIVFDIIAGA